MTASRKLKEVHYLLADGHSTIFSAKFKSSLPTYLCKSFHSPCDISPTSWSFRISFQLASDNSNVECLVEINRTDIREISMNVEFSLRLFPLSFIKLPPLIYKIENMQAGATESKIFDAVIPNDILRGISDGEVLVHISFDVSGCHQ